MKRLWMVKGVAASLAGVALLATAGDASATECSAIPNKVVLAGSSAIESVLAKLSPVLQAAANPVDIVYVSIGSCAGIQDVTGTAATGSGVIWDTSGNQIAGGCTITAPNTLPVDIGISDVYPQTCVDQGVLTSLPATGFADFTGPIQAMTFIVPSASTQKSISAEAAFAILGWAGTGMYDVAPWTASPNTSIANIFIRNNTSGTETMIATEIGLPATKWKGTTPTMNSSGGVIAAVSGATPVEDGLGIVAAQSAQAVSTVNILTFQAKQQECGYLPDSSSTTRDKINVREGRYDIWGPEHFYTAVDSTGVPTNPAAKVVTDAISLTSPTDATAMPVVQAEATANVVPQCAMKVKRTAEVGAEMSFQPTGDCSCFFEATATATAPAGCQTCTMNSDCTDAGASHCNYGYCEAM